MACGCLSAESDGCGETCDRFCPCVSMYPRLCTVFLSLVAAAVISSIFGAYAFISQRTSIFRFDWQPFWRVVVHSSVLALISTTLLISLAILLWCVCSTRGRSRFFKLFYVLFLFVTVLALAATMVGSILIIIGASKKDSAFARELEHVWMDSINNKSFTPCRIQNQLDCRGFEEGDCQARLQFSNFSRCATTCRSEDIDGKPMFDSFLHPGCREKISFFYVLWNSILLSGVSLACILAVVSLFVTCASISFELEK